MPTYPASVVYMAAIGSALIGFLFGYATPWLRRWVTKPTRAETTFQAYLETQNLPK